MSSGVQVKEQKTIMLPGLVTEFYMSGDGVFKKSNNELVFVHTKEGWIGVTKFTVEDPAWLKVLNENYAG